MNIPRFAKRKDANHNAIQSALEQIGVGVIDVSASGNGLTDLVCFWRGRIVLAEIKDGSKPPSRQKLTPMQVELRDMARRHGVTIPIFTSVEEALGYFGARRIV